MNLSHHLLVFLTLATMECLAVSIPYIEQKSWIRYKRSSLRSTEEDEDCPDCLSSEDEETRSDCLLEREERRRLATLTRSVSEYIPVCRKDGSYAPVQCHPSTRSCWCVTEYGRPIAGTSVLSNGTNSSKPDCSRFQQRRIKSTPRRRSSQAKKSCNHADRSRFNSALIKTFRSEFNRVRTLFSSTMYRDADVNNDEVVLTWKFDHLDRNKDAILQRNETHILRSLVKQQIQPRQCAKSFIAYCSKGDKLIAKKEWLECLRVASTMDNLPFDTFNSLVDSGSSRGNLLHPSQLLRPGGSLSPSGTEMSPLINARGSDVAEVSNCWTDRHSALASQKQNDSLLVPECTPTGQYQKTQCAQGKVYCWCVEEDTGIQIPNTIVINSTPDCEKRAKPMKGCSGSKKQKFLVDFYDVISKKMTRVTGHNKRLPGNVPNATNEEQLARWYFDELDANDNGILDRKEWKMLRNETSSDPKLKRCGKKLPRHCDANQDKKISLTEWFECLGAKSSDTTPHKRPVHRSHGPRQGKNPFTTILKQ